MRHQSKISKIQENEPRWQPTEQPDTQLATLLNWYNYNKRTEDAQKYFVEYLSESGVSQDTIIKIKNRTDLPVTTTIGFLCRIKLVNGVMVPDKYDKKIEDVKNLVMQIVQSGTDAPAIKNTQEDKKPTIQDNIENQVRELIGFVSIEIDKFLQKKCKHTFDVYDWLKTNAVKHQQAKLLGDHFQKTLLSELHEAKNGSCEQLKEAYSFLSKTELKKYVEFVQNLVDETFRWSGVAKQISLNNKTPRVRKTKPAAKQVEKLNFLKEHENLKSIPPSQIVGATQLWVYNVKYRTLGVYVCNNPHGFSVKGSTILNFDVNESISKKLRKPNDVIPKVLDAGKVALRKILPNIRCKENKLTGRINKDTILLKAV